MKGLPEQGQTCFVIAPSGATLDARVEECEPSHTLLSFGAAARDPIAVLAGGNISIQYTNRRGVCRIDGVAHSHKREGILRVDHTSKIQLIQRREFVRVDAMVPVSYKPMGGTGWVAETTTVNVSGGGFMIAGREGLRIGEIRQFTLALDGDTEDAGELEVTGEVVRETDAGLGIRLLELEEAERDRLIRWVFARERLARQIVRGG
jgi:c-di-GMP-binding flagellar brake protein YcgR